MTLPATADQATAPEPTEQVVVAILRCPLSGQPLRAMTEAERAHLATRTGTLKHRDGAPVARDARVGLCSADGKIAYQSRAGIVELLAERAIPLDQAAADECAHLTADKEIVRQFYDDYGWQQADDGVYLDTAKYADFRPVSAGSLDASHKRVKQYLLAEGAISSTSRRVRCTTPISSIPTASITGFASTSPWPHCGKRHGVSVTAAYTSSAI
jgi:hypothetical protein